MNDNPYQPIDTSRVIVDRQPASLLRWAAWGFIFVCAPVAAFGAYGLYADAQYAAALPPNVARCGNGAMAAMLMICPVSPVLGVVGSIIRLVSACVCNALTVGGARMKCDDNR